MTSFSAQLDAFALKTRNRARAVFRESVQRVVGEMQRPVGAGGNMPVDTGFLRNSLMASTSMVPLANRANPGGIVSGGPFADVSLVIAGLELGDEINLGYTANYAGYVNYGAQGRPPRRFVELAAQQWPTIVAKVTAELRARAGG